MAMQMQSLLPTQMGSFAIINGSTRSTIPNSFGFAPITAHKTGLRLKCSADKESEIQSSSSSSSKPNPTLSSLPNNPIPTPKPQPKVSTNLGDLFAFSGPVPERINGRLAMIGFVAAIAVELSNGSDLLDQISNGGGVWFLGTTILLSTASLVPLLKGKRAESITEGIMNSSVELLNGRVAMLGLMAFAFTEFVKGGALI